MTLKSARTAASGGFLAVAIATHALAASPAAAQSPGPTPERQLTYDQSGIRLSLGALVIGQPKVVVTLVVENDRDAPIHFAALSGRTMSGLSQAVLSDNAGTACMAEANPTGIAEIAHLAQAPRPPTASMTTIPPRSRMNAVFRFAGCHLSGASLSFAGEFALSTNARDAELVTVPFWGIMPTPAR